MATMGKNIAKELNIIAVPVSVVETIGFARPAVFTDDANRVNDVIACTPVAVPPPAIKANIQVIIGLTSTIVEAIITVPAIAAKGVAIVSNKLSINGI